MAKRLTDFPFTRTGRPSKYPWDEWLDGSVWELVRGEDFQTTTATIRTQAHKMAYTKYGKLRTRIDGDRLVLQFIKVEE